MLGRVVTGYPANWFINILFGDEKCAGRTRDKNYSIGKTRDSRLNARYTRTNLTDKMTRPGMNIPSCITNQSKYPSPGNDVWLALNPCPLHWAIACLRLQNS